MRTEPEQKRTDTVETQPYVTVWFIFGSLSKARVNRELITEPDRDHTEQKN